MADRRGVLRRLLLRRLGHGMTYDCMSPDELALWREGAAELARRHHGYTATKPCVDCPLTFRAAEYAAGRCCLPEPVSWEVAEARRAYKREWMAMRRQRVLGGSAVGLAGVQS